MSERNKVVYVTIGAQAGQKLVVDIPHGLVPPPFIELHKPHEGAVVFYSAEGYQLPIPKD